MVQNVHCPNLFFNFYNYILQLTVLTEKKKRQLDTIIKIFATTYVDISKRYISGNLKCPQFSD